MFEIAEPRATLIRREKPAIHACSGYHESHTRGGPRPTSPYFDTRVPNVSERGREAAEASHSLTWRGDVGEASRRQRTAAARRESARAVTLLAPAQGFDECRARWRARRG